MNVRYYIDPATGEPHIYRHDVSEDEVEQVLSRPGEDRPGRDGSRVAIGQTEAGRYLRVIYVPDPEPGNIFVREPIGERCGCGGRGRVRGPKSSLHGDPG